MLPNTYIDEDTKLLLKFNQKRDRNTTESYLKELYYFQRLTEIADEISKLRNQEKLHNALEALKANLINDLCTIINNKIENGEELGIHKILNNSEAYTVAENTVKMWGEMNDPANQNDISKKEKIVLNYYENNKEKSKSENFAKTFFEVFCGVVGLFFGSIAGAAMGTVAGCVIGIPYAMYKLGKAGYKEGLNFGKSITNRQNTPSKNIHQISGQVENFTKNALTFFGSSVILNTDKKEIKKQNNNTNTSSLVNPRLAII
jgi:hypothetical protein